MKWVLVVAVAAVSVQALDDVPGATDPEGIDRFPRSWIVEYAFEAEALPYEFVIAPAVRIRQELRLESVRVNGPLQRVTYRIPDGARLDDVIEHYERHVTAISPGVVFSCRGPDCGRSTIWANDVFGKANLVAPNRNQFYIAAPITVDGQSKLVAIYAVQRGNRRLYVHVDVIVPDRVIAFEANSALAESLARTGFAVVGGVIPDAVGGFTADDLAKLELVSATLTPFNREVIHVVCHLYGSQPVVELTEGSLRCAQTVARTIEEVSGVGTEAHGVGPLVPRDAVAKPRVELVLPYRLKRE